MTNEEAIKVLLDEWKCIDRNDGINCDRKCESCDLVMDSFVLKDAYNMAIKALSYDDAKYHAEHGEVVVDKAVWEDAEKALQEPCEDAISRRAVLDLLEDTNNGWIINEVLQLPSVNPQHSGDLISRQDAIKAIKEKAKRIKNEDTLNGLSGAVGILFDLPSVTQKPIECDDAISRQGDDRWLIHFGQNMAIPSAEPYKGMTNGEVIKAVFPSAEYKIIRKMSGMDYVEIHGMSTYGFSVTIDLEWWNSPYEPQESEDKE